ncbi:glucose-6-phosphate isomerase [Mycoplasma tauri]|uniref:glucose-6-phosphate isomerase n=1 Tax=Mycoplasma tauri TaxID=547987 RepID=UPI001CBE56A4|nr:glucose-6-phosphate isomerase [Mycoplasma tauri]MBZ4204118.1 glucose-6-phosphate isomerase [Mycoplasma tauri]
MSRIEINFVNYSPEFNNKNLIEKASKLFENIRKKNVKGFEHFGFHDLVLNFDKQNFLELTNFSNHLHSRECDNLIIFCNPNDMKNFDLANSFLFKNDLLENNRIKMHFFVDQRPELWQRVYLNIKHLFFNKKTSFLFIGQSKYSDEFLEFIKLILNKIQLEEGYYRALKRCYVIAKQALEKQLSFIEIEEENKIIMPSILTNGFSFFAESNLFLLLIKGCNLFSLIEGYESTIQNFNNENLEENIAFQYAYTRSLKGKVLNYHFITSNNMILHNLLVLQANMNNNFLKNNNFSYFCTFPDSIYSYGQYIIDNNKNMYVTFYNIKDEKLDYQLSDDIHINDGIENYNTTKVSKFRNSSDEGIIEVISNVLSIPMCIITLLDNSISTLGSLIAFIYWSWIYECYLNETNPFEI